MDPNVTFASLLEPAGVVTAAAAITAFVELIKNVFPKISDRVSGAAMAFALSGVLYVLAGFATSVGSLDAGLVVFLAWLGCATSAVGISSTATHVNEVRSTTNG